MGFGMGFGIWDGIWDGMGVGILPFPLIWVASIDIAYLYHLKDLVYQTN